MVQQDNTYGGVVLQWPRGVCIGRCPGKEREGGRKERREGGRGVGGKVGREGESVEIGGALVVDIVHTLCVLAFRF